MIARDFQSDLSMPDHEKENEGKQAVCRHRAWLCAKLIREHIMVIKNLTAFPTNISWSGNTSKSRGCQLRWHKSLCSSFPERYPSEEG